MCRVLALGEESSQQVVAWIKVEWEGGYWSVRSAAAGKTVSSGYENQAAHFCSKCDATQSAAPGWTIYNGAIPCIISTDAFDRCPIDQLVAQHTSQWCYDGFTSGTLRHTLQVYAPASSLSVTDACQGMQGIVATHPQDVDI